MMFVCSSLLVLFHFCLPNSLLLKEGKVGIVKSGTLISQLLADVCVCGWLAD